MNRKITAILSVALISIFTLSPLAYAADETTVEHQIPHAFITGGTAQNFHEDDEFFEYDLPFPFTFYGKTYNKIWVTSNSSVAFSDQPDEEYDDNMDNYEMDITDTTDGIKRILVNDADMDTYNGDFPNDDIYIDSNSSRFVVRWENTFLGSSIRVNSELVLYPNGNFQLNYGDNPDQFSQPVTVGITDGTGNYTASILNGLNNSEEEFNNPQSLYWGEVTESRASANVKTFKKDTRCLWKKPYSPTWIKLQSSQKEGKAGMLLTWTQYGADKVNIKIDDGTGNFPWQISNVSNDGSEFLQGVQSWQKIKLQPINHCKTGEYGEAVSNSLFPDGWYNIK